MKLIFQSKRLHEIHRFTLRVWSHVCIDKLALSLPKNVGIRLMGIAVILLSGTPIHLSTKQSILIYKQKWSLK